MSSHEVVHSNEEQAMGFLRIDTYFKTQNSDFSGFTHKKLKSCHWSNK